MEQDLFGSLVLGSDKKKVGKVLAPLEPKAIICIGLNYAKHAAESGTGQGAIHQQGRGSRGVARIPWGPFIEAHVACSERLPALLNPPG